MKSLSMLRKFLKSLLELLLAMPTLLLLFTLLCLTSTKVLDKEQFCSNLNCEGIDNKTLCGMKKEGGGVKLRIFPNQCLLMKHGCNADKGSEYGLTDIILCKRAFPSYFKDNDNKDAQPVTTEYYERFYNKDNAIPDPCMEYCAHLSDTELACGITKEGSQFRVRLFSTRCEMIKYNCLKNGTFQVTDDLNVCGGLEVADLDEDFEDYGATNGDTIGEMSNHEIVKEGNIFDEDTVTEANQEINPLTPLSEKIQDNKDYTIKTYKQVVIVDQSMLNYSGNVNDSIENFFRSTHASDLPLRDLNNDTEARRMLLKYVGPVKVFQPWINTPKNLKNISTDRWHEPTLSSCYHTCPKQCPDTYAPVCGVPGTIAREPSLVFMNHCFMDVAQCKMRWEDKSETSWSSAYVESSFVFCLGDVLSDYLRFLPLVRTLQHMGRLKKKGVYNYKIRNMGRFNNYLLREPKVMG